MMTEITINHNCHAGLRHALIEAATSTANKYRVGCVVMMGKGIISSATNSEKTHPTQKIYNRYRGLTEESIVHKAHAEILALSKCKYTVHLDCDVYVARVDDKGSPRMARPCKACMKMIEDSGCKSVWWTTNEPNTFGVHFF
jgi:pyrimidine deaminase RibD-like protein